MRGQQDTIPQDLMHLHTCRGGVAASWRCGGSPAMT